MKMLVFRKRIKLLTVSAKRTENTASEGGDVLRALM
jgi:hypothetical protein